jgi:hypothetical protein
MFMSLTTGPDPVEADLERQTFAAVGLDHAPEADGGARALLQGGRRAAGVSE